MQVVIPITNENPELLEITLDSWLSHGPLKGVTLQLISSRKDLEALKKANKKVSEAKVFDRVNAASTILSDNTILNSGLWSAYFRADQPDSFWASAGTLLLDNGVLDAFQALSKSSRSHVFGPIGSVHPTAFYRRGASKFIRPWQLNMARGVHGPLEKELAQRLAAVYSGTPLISLYPSKKSEVPEGALIALVDGVVAAKAILAKKDPKAKPAPKPEEPVEEEGLTEAVSPRIIRRTSDN